MVKSLVNTISPFQAKGKPTKRALDGWDSAPFLSFIYTQAESCSRSFIHVRPPAGNANRWAVANDDYIEGLSH